MICCDRFFIFLSLATLAQNRTIPRKPPTLLPYERSVGFASLRNSGRSTSSIHARPLSKVRCCRPKEFGRLPEELSHQPFAPHQPFKNCTIPLAFRRGVGLPLPLHRPSPSPQPLQKAIVPRSALPHLPPLSKGGGLTARHKLLLCCVLLAICPLFLYCKLFCRQDGGIASVASTLSIPTTIAKRQ